MWGDGVALCASPGRFLIECVGVGDAFVVICRSALFQGHLTDHSEKTGKREDNSAVALLENSSVAQ